MGLAYRWRQAGQICYSSKDHSVRWQSIPYFFFVVIQQSVCSCQLILLLWLNPNTYMSVTSANTSLINAWLIVFLERNKLRGASEKSQNMCLIINSPYNFSNLKKYEHTCLVNYSNKGFTIIN